MLLYIHRTHKYFCSSNGISYRIRASEVWPERDKHTTMELYLHYETLYKSYTEFSNQYPLRFTVVPANGFFCLNRVRFSWSCILQRTPRG